MSEYRDNNFTPHNASEQVVLKEYVFENVSLTINPGNTQTNSVPAEAHNVPTKEMPIESNINPPGEDENGQLTGIITSEKAYFYQDKSLSTQKKAYLVKGDKVKYFAAKEDDFNMVFYTNIAGKTTSGWMLKESIK